MSEQEHICPVQGCDVGFSKASSVHAHVTRREGDHKGYKWQDSERALDNGESLPGQDTEESDENAEESDEGTRRSVPSPTASGSTCPACDGAQDDVKQASEYREYIPEQYRGDYEKLCINCGELFNE